ncbi:MAG: hypothetical protein ACKVQC_01360 [Elusimicrobiota bacterium]
MTAKEIFRKKTDHLIRWAKRFDKAVESELAKLELLFQQATVETEKEKNSQLQKIQEEEIRLKGLIEQSGKEYSQDKYKLERDVSNSKNDVERTQASLNSIHKEFETEFNRIHQEKLNIQLTMERQKSALTELYQEKKRSLTVARAKLLQEARQTEENYKKVKQKSDEDQCAIKTEIGTKLNIIQDQAESKKQGWDMALEKMRKELAAIHQEKDDLQKKLLSIREEKEKELEDVKVSLKLSKDQLEIDKVTLIEKAEEEERLCAKEVAELQKKIEHDEKALEILILESEKNKKELEEGYHREESILKESVQAESQKRDFEQKLFEQEKLTKEKELQRLKEEYDKRKWQWDNQVRTLMMQKSVLDAQYDADRLKVDREARLQVRGLEAKRGELRQRLSELQNRKDTIKETGQKEQDLIQQRWKWRRERLWGMWQNRLQVLKKERLVLQEQIQDIQEKFSKESSSSAEMEQREEKRIDDLREFVLQMSEKNRGQNKQKGIQNELEKTRLIAQIKECEALVENWVERMKMTQDDVMKANQGLAQELNYLDKWYREEEKETQLFLHEFQNALSILNQALSSITLKDAA